MISSLQLWYKLPLFIYNGVVFSFKEGVISFVEVMNTILFENNILEYFF